MSAATDARSRFLQNVVVSESGCWLWQGWVNRWGYGQMRHDGKTQRVHRVAFEMFRSPIPDGLPLDHICHTNDAECGGGVGCMHRRCANPDHLEVVTPRENVLRGEGHAARLASASECKRGHELAGDNLILERRPNRSIGFQRRCRTCRLEHYRNRRARAA